MFNFPYLGYSNNNPYYQYYNRHRNYTNISKNIPNEKYCEENSTSEKIEEKEVQRDFNSLDNNNNDNPIFEILGIRLYSDDLIILAILFLLYEQNVKDEMLYIILFLLLFS